MVGPASNGFNSFQNYSDNFSDDQSEQEELEARGRGNQKIDEAIQENTAGIEKEEQVFKKEEVKAEVNGARMGISNPIDSLTEFSTKDLQGNYSRHNILARTPSDALNHELSQFEQTVARLKKEGILVKDNDSGKLKLSGDAVKFLNKELTGRHEQKGQVKNEYKSVMVFEGFKFRMANLDEHQDKMKLQSGEEFARIDTSGDRPRLEVPNEAVKEKALKYMTYTDHSGKEAKFQPDDVRVMNQEQKDKIKNDIIKYDRLDHEIKHLQIERDRLVDSLREFQRQKEAQAAKPQKNVPSSDVPTRNEPSLKRTEHSKEKGRKEGKELADKVVEKNASKAARAAHQAQIQVAIQNKRIDKANERKAEDQKAVKDKEIDKKLEQRERIREENSREDKDKMEAA